MPETDATERTLTTRFGRPDAVLGAIAGLLVAAVCAALLSPLAAMPTLAVGCLGCLVVIGEALFVHPPVDG